MTSAAAFWGVSSQTNRLVEFLRAELTATPQRWQQTLRITLACVIASWAVMAFHLKFSLLVMILMFLITQQDTTTTAIVTIMGIIGLTAGCVLLELTYISVVDIPWLRILLVPTYIALGLFINRIFVLGPVGSAIGIPLALGMLFPDIIPQAEGPVRLPAFSTEFVSRFPSMLWWAGTLGLLVSLAVQYMLNPISARSLLVRGLTSRLGAVEVALRRLAGDEGKLQAPARLVSLAVEGATRQLSLLKLTSLVDPWLKQHRAQVNAQIILVDRWVTAAAALEQQGIQNPSEATRTRLRRLAEAARIWREAVLKRHWPELPESAEAVQSERGALPALGEMERVLELMAASKAGTRLPDELTALPRVLKGGLIVSDAFRNPDYVHSAVKGALAGLICYLIFTLSAYQEIYTSVVTCVVCSLSTVGASVQKGVLRFSGSVLGGVLGVFTLMYVFPHLDSIAGFWVPFAAVTALAAYISVGSPAISYGGYQIGLAFYKCTLQAYGPYTELRVVRDRLIGILLGLIVFELINTRLWPVKALDVMRAKLSSALQALATLAGLSDEAGSPKAQLLESYELRLKAYQDFGAVHQLLAGSKFERGEAVRRKLEAMSTTAERLLLYLLAINQHRLDLRPEAVPQPLRGAGLRFRNTLADELQILADKTIGREERPDQNLQGALIELERSVAAQIGAVTDAAVAAQIRARLALYQEVVPIISLLLQQTIVSGA